MKIFRVRKFIKLCIKLKSQKIPYKKPDLQKRISSKEIPENIDYLIIGSGLSGLMSAAFLSKLNKKVVVLEQHDRAGGCLHTFDKDGFEFNTGLHYLGNDNMLQSVLSVVETKTLEYAV